MKGVPELKQLTVITKEPGKAPEVQRIDNTLDVLKHLVGGWLESLPFPGGLVMLCNEEGKLFGLSPNITMPQYQDIILGPIVITKSDRKGDFTDLTTHDQIMAINTLKRL
jgi:hypothetical protein